MLKRESRLGGGRSGEVFLVQQDGQQIARKVFGGDRLARLVHYFFSGAPNPYVWNEDALRCAYHRRRVTAALVAYWFGPRLNVAEALGYSWNENARSWQLDTRFVPGRPLPLCHPLRDRAEEVDTLYREIMLPLQQRLQEAGLDGLVWQAGKGNPVALNNFLLTGGDDEPQSFCFIDLESGVPALFPLHPWTLLSFYLPKSLRHGRALFDDVDVAKLRRYVDEQQSGLVNELGEERYHAMRQDIDALEKHQRQWKAMPRVERAITYQRRKGRISRETAEWYRRRSVRWRVRETSRAAKKIAFAVLWRLPRAVARKVAGIEFRAISIRTWKLISSQAYRAEFARSFVRERIEHWHNRGQLTDADRQILLEELDGNEAGPYMTDFGAHIGMKVAVQTLELTLFSALFTMGIISGYFLAALILADGIIYRTSYSLYRSMHAARHFQPPPWVALAVGLLPLLGSLAYPAQMVWSAVGKEDRVARFIIYDTFTALGAKLPIWGDSDTLTEHFFNRIAHRLVRRPAE